MEKSAPSTQYSCNEEGEERILSALRGCLGLPGLGSRQFSNRESLTSSLDPL